jgi:hypothetical protein
VTSHFGTLERRIYILKVPGKKIHTTFPKRSIKQPTGGAVAPGRPGILPG